MKSLLLRDANQSLTAYEKPAHPSPVKFYLEDGNHRALVSAVFLMLNAVKYEPVQVIFSDDWTHLYPWAQVPSDAEAEELPR